MLNRPTVRVQYRFSELEACALKRASLRAPSSFANAEPANVPRAEATMILVEPGERPSDAAITSASRWAAVS